MQLRVDGVISMLSGETLNCTRIRALLAVVVDEGISEQSAEPGDGTLALYRHRTALEDPHEGVLEQLLRCHAASHSTLKEGKKALPILDQHPLRFRRQRERGVFRGCWAIRIHGLTVMLQSQLRFQGRRCP